MTAPLLRACPSWAFTALLSAGLAPGAAAAADDLYAAAPPAGSAFVRLVNAQPGSAALDASIGGKSAGKVAFGEASAYVVVPQGDREADFAGKGKQGFAVAAGGFYTVALTPGGVVVVNDGTNTNLAKALVSLYNFSGKPTLDLKTADGATTVVAGVAGGTAGSRAVNPLTVGFVATSGADVLYTQPQVTLDRGAAYSLIVMGPPEKPTGAWVKSATKAN